MTNQKKYLCKDCKNKFRKKGTRGTDPTRCPKCLKKHNTSYARSYQRTARGSTSTHIKRNESFWNRQPFGKLTDTDLANRLMVSPTTVMKQRHRRGISKYNRTVTPNPKKIQKYIQQRNDRGLSQMDLADIICIPQSTIAKIEKGRRVLTEIYARYEKKMATL